MVILRTGVDIIEIERFASAYKRYGRRLLQRLFTINEIIENGENIASLAARFAAKEAVIKASGSRASIPLVDIEVVNDERGNPTIQARGALEAFFRRNAFSKVHLSMSHEKEYGIAFVVLERQDIC